MLQKEFLNLRYCNVNLIWSSYRFMTIWFLEYSAFVIWRSWKACEERWSNWGNDKNKMIFDSVWCLFVSTLLFFYIPSSPHPSPFFFRKTKFYNLIVLCHTLLQTKNKVRKSTPSFVEKYHHFCLVFSFAPSQTEFFWPLLLLLMQFQWRIELWEQTEA